MSNHEYVFEGELAALQIRTAKKTGTKYASGILILRDENGKFESSHKFRSFNAVDVLQVLELQYFAKAAPSADTSGGDLHFADGEAESTETRERTVAEATARPQVKVAGKFRTNKFGANWETVIMVESVSI